MSFQDYVLAKKHKTVIANMCAHERLSTSELLRIDLQRIATSPWADVTVQVKLGVHKAIDGCMALLGFESVLDTANVVPDATFKEHQLKLIELCKTSSVARGTRFRVTSAVGAVSKELREVFGIALKRQREGKHTISYTLVPDKEIHELAQQSDFYQDLEIRPVMRTWQECDRECGDEEYQDAFANFAQTLAKKEAFEEAMRAHDLRIVINDLGVEVGKQVWDARSLFQSTIEAKS
jgi:hypothetical protein